MGEVWPTAHITELCLQLTAGSRPVNGDEHRTLRSQSCERALLTTGTLPFLPLLSSLLGIFLTHCYITRRVYWQLLDLSVLHSGWLQFSYSVLAASCLHYHISPEIALAVSGMPIMYRMSGSFDSNFTNSQNDFSWWFFCAGTLGKKFPAN